jgi:hypothetical protein
MEKKSLANLSLTFTRESSAGSHGGTTVLGKRRRANGGGSGPMTYGRSPHHVDVMICRAATASADCGLPGSMSRWRTRMAFNCGDQPSVPT